MPNTDHYLTEYPTITLLNQAVIVGRFIDEKPSVITIVDRVSGAAPGGTQTVRLEPMSNQVAEQMGVNVVAENETVVIHGYKGHPTVTATNLKRGDRFTVAGMDSNTVYDVINIVETFTDRLLASARVQ